ncbi:MAG: (deoxy)nucleoside triphosphate pyrophosphohydrolase [Clostridia bacterium]|nr:(deoxy)nucleoside triphosphate pyrophosphohydrolase [Clostridia bacterium]
MVEVVAALIFENNKFMICQRPENKTRGLLWEFVGGKVEKGETKKQALVRECMEELGVVVEVGEVFCDVVHEYPDITVHLTLFTAKIICGTLQRLEHNDVKWITADEIDNFKFCPADDEILKKLKANLSKRV